MSYETLVEQVKTLPEACLDAASNYMQFLLYQYQQEKMEALAETDAVFEQHLQNGYDDMRAGRVTPLDAAFAEIRER